MLVLSESFKTALFAKSNAQRKVCERERQTERQTIDVETHICEREKGRRRRKSFYPKVNIKFTFSPSILVWSGQLRMG